MINIFWIVLLYLPSLLIFRSDFVVESANYSPSTKEKLKSEKLPPCAACRVLTESFKKGVERTKRGKFEGGDSAWEEDKLKSYAKSEVRLTEIQENLCKDVERGEDQCHALAGEMEQSIEVWWSKYQEKYSDIYEYVCVIDMERCCQKDHYGPACEPCPGYPDKVCNNNGKCKGAGTRKGNGQCACDPGYAGENCQECADGFYESYKDENKMLCSACHPACTGNCKGATPDDCQDGCSEGWRMSGESSCLDIDECLHSDEYCPGNQFCINEEGNYSCLKCDRACDGCSGDGPDMCNECADGYERKDNICTSPDILDRKKKEDWTRYLTYIGFLIATLILILQGNIYAAGMIGILVAVYISASEYTIANGTIQSGTPEMDSLRSVEWMEEG